VVASGVATGGARGCNAPSVNGFAPPVNFLKESGRLFSIFSVRYYGGELRENVTSSDRENMNFIF
jgi:hypothetical protein